MERIALSTVLWHREADPSTLAMSEVRKHVKDSESDPLRSREKATDAIARGCRLLRVGYCREASRIGGHRIAVDGSAGVLGTRRAAIWVSSNDMNFALAIAGMWLIRALKNERVFTGRDWPEWESGHRQRNWQLALLNATPL